MHMGLKTDREYHNLRAVGRELNDEAVYDGMQEIWIYNRRAEIDGDVSMPNSAYLP
jgi:hypothetical protein